jgi:hypothetical protein
MSHHRREAFRESSQNTKPQSSPEHPLTLDHRPVSRAAAKVAATWPSVPSAPDAAVTKADSRSRIEAQSGVAAGVLNGGRPQAGPEVPSPLKLLHRHLPRTPVLGEPGPELLGRPQFVVHPRVGRVEEVDEQEQIVGHEPVVGLQSDLLRSLR